MTEMSYAPPNPNPPVPPVAARAVEVVKTYGAGGTAVHALAGVTVDLDAR